MNRCKKNKLMTIDQVRELIASDLKKDLHMHSIYSDGALTPQELIDRRASEGYELLAVTDHDGIEGSVIGMEYARSVGMKFIYGIEFDSADELGKELHILGYGLDPENPELKDVLLEVLLTRARRNDRLLNTLRSYGYEITLDDIGEINEGRYVGKPTFALILRNKGYAESIRDAFETIFSKDDLRKIRKESLPTKDVIDVIHKSGGLAVMAHPMEQRRKSESFADFKPRMYKIMDRMIEYGIDGIECFHPSASEEQSKLLVAYAGEHGLMITRGSDFHSDETKRDYSWYHRP